MPPRAGSPETKKKKIFRLRGFYRFAGGLALWGHAARFRVEDIDIYKYYGIMRGPGATICTRHWNE